MFLWFIKPKARKVYDDFEDSWFHHNLHAPFFLLKIISHIMWFLCLPFLLMSYSETIMPFMYVTIACVVTDFLEKIFHDEYKYF